MWPIPKVIALTAIALFTFSFSIILKRKPLKIISSIKEENTSPRHKHSNDITCPSLKHYKEHEDDGSDDDTDDEDDNFLSQKELDFADVDERKITITPIHRIRQKGNKTIEAPQGYSKALQGANYSPILSGRES